MRHATAGVLPAVCAALAASVASAQSSSLDGHSSATRSPVTLLGTEDDIGGDVERPALPPRIAQYPLENDPYERPPYFPSDQGPPTIPQSPYIVPPTPPLPAAEEEVGWIKFDQFRLNAGVLHDSPDGLGITDVVTT